MRSFFKNTKSIKALTPDYWLYGLIAVHVFFWTMIPTLFRTVLPMDSLEGYVWGQHLVLGYDRNPWLNAWLTTLALKLGGYSGWMIYLFSQISVAICFWAVYRLGRKFLPAIYALVAVLLLEGIQFYSIAAVDFNDNVLEIGLWALICLYYYSATKEQKICDWLLVGLFAALATMAKYYAIMLFAPMFIFLITNKDARISFKKSGLYLSGLVFLIITLPHFIWLFNQDLATINYAVRRASEQNVPGSSPFHFALVYLGTFILPLLLFSILLIGKKTQSALGEQVKLTKFEKQFLCIIGFGPFVLTVVTAIIFRMTLHTLWGTPLLILWGLILVAFTQPYITKPKFYRFVSGVALIFLLMLGGYLYSMLCVDKASSSNYPGPETSKYVIELWQKKYHSLPHFVAGDRYSAGYVSYYAKNKPEVYILDYEAKSLIDVAKLYQYGAVFVWREDKKDSDIKQRILANFPEVKIIAKKNFNWMRGKKAPPIVLGVGFLAPR